jgi:MFS family permease
VFAIPELLRTKWRHIGVAIADTSIMFDVICGPSLSRFATTDTSSWRWIFYVNAIASGVVGTLLFFFYYPPKHPRGLSWHRAIRDLDYAGGLLFVAATVAILSGICYASSRPSTDPQVLALLVTGFGVLILFSLWETFGNARQPLTPTRLFTHNRGRTLSVPFLLSAVVTVYYLGINIIWGTMVSLFFARSTTEAAQLSLVQGFGFMGGALAMAYCGSIIKRWRTTMFFAAFFATLFGGLLALVRPDRRGLAIACTFLNSFAYGWSQILSITFCQFGADQSELGISGGLAWVSFL